MPRIAVLTIGDELLNGDLADSNTAAIARLLGSRAYVVREAATVGDRETDIVAALQRLAGGHDVVIVTGGLGPTDDDRTARAAARAFNRPLSLNDKALQQIRDRFRAWGRAMHPRNEKQALLPARAAVLANRQGTAPGFRLQVAEADLYFLPGVPLEMSVMLDEEILPRLREDFPDPPPRTQRVMTIFGLPEPEVESRLIAEGLPAGTELAFAVDFPMVLVKLRAAGAEAETLVDRAELVVRQALGDHVIGIGTETLAGNTARLLRLAGQTLALAESCTGGLIAELLTDSPGASDFLERSVVTYADTAKTALLGVPPTLLAEHGAVSAACARAMPRGVRSCAGTDLGLAVTGIAGPEGDSPDKPVGTVYIALAADGHERLERFVFPGDRAQVRLRTACTALDWLRRLAGDLITSGSPLAKE